MVTRRHFLALSGSLFSASLSSPAFAKTWPSTAEKAAWDAQITPANYDPATTNPWGLHPRLLPQRVLANDGLRPGDIHVDAIARYLYHIEEGGTAMRYGVAIAKGDLYEPGTYTIRRKVEWPHWTPTQSMIERDPWAAGLCIYSSEIGIRTFEFTERRALAALAAGPVRDACAW